MKRADKFTRKDEVILLLEHNPGWRKQSWIRSQMRGGVQSTALSYVLHQLLEEGVIEFMEHEPGCAYTFAEMRVPRPPGPTRHPRSWRLKDEAP
jgi:hypothetical protein